MIEYLLNGIQTLSLKKDKRYSVKTLTLVSSLPFIPDSWSTEEIM